MMLQWCNDAKASMGDGADEVGTVGRMSGA
jgi:hypothetical protein